MTKEMGIMHHHSALLIAPALLAASSFCSCDNRPDDVLSESKTTEVLADMQLAQSYMERNASMYTSSEARHALKLAILDSHGVTETEFDRTIEWYGHNMDRYSKLYVNVAKKLEKEKSKIDGSSSSESEMPADASSIWPYAQNALVWHNGASDGLTFSISPHLDKGEQINWQMRLSNSSPVIAVIGVEYTDGAFSILDRTFSGSRKVDLKLQTDSTRDIKRVYGSLSVQDSKSLPLWIDSISLSHSPLKSDLYSIYDYQKNFLPPGQNRAEKLRKKPDSDSESSKAQPASEASERTSGSATSGASMGQEINPAIMHTGAPPSAGRPLPLRKPGEGSTIHSRTKK